jgi:signal transduction histidine kinase/putative effector of murein hydrolase LrgA (UPF0299 family)
MDIPKKLSYTKPKWCLITTSLFCLIVFIVSCATLMGWEYDILILKSITSSWVTMLPNMAVFFILSSTALWFSRHEDTDFSHKIITAISASIALLLAGATLYEYISGINLGIDQLLFPNSYLPDTRYFHAGRMFPLAAIDATFIAIALLFINNTEKVWLPQTLLVAVFFSSLFVLLGYLYQAHELYIYTKLAFHDAILFLLLSVAILFSRPNNGITYILTRNRIGGKSLRNSIVFIFLIPILLGYLRYVDNQAYPFSFGFNLAIIIIGFIIAFVTLAWINAWLLDQQTEKLALSEERLRLALSASRGGIWSWDIATNTIIWDEQTTYLFGKKTNPSPLNFEEFINYIYVEDRNNILGEKDKTFNEKSEFEISFRVIHSDKSVHVIGSRGKSYVDNANAPSYMTGVCWDMTEQRLAEEKMKEAKELAENASRIKSNFMAKISHDLRSPLNGIIGFSELMYHEKVGPISKEHKEYLGDILSSSRQLLLLINDVLDIAKVESGKMDFFPESIDLDKILSETKDIFHTMITTKHIQFETDLDPTLKHIKIDQTRFKQVIYNYVSNAIKYTPEGGKVIVRIMPDHAGLLRIEVEDTGIGIHHDDLPRLFVEFQQMNNNIAKDYPSSGLGLALTRHIVEAQGGRVGANSTFEKGSTFFAILPFAKP